MTIAKAHRLKNFIRKAGSYVINSTEKKLNKVATKCQIGKKTIDTGFELPNEQAL